MLKQSWKVSVKMETKKHWTSKSIEDYIFRIKADAITQIEDITSTNIEYPEKYSLEDIIKLTIQNKLKISLVVYDDNDSENKRGPIISDIFRICWEKCGKPKDFWKLNKKEKSYKQIKSVEHIDVKIIIDDLEGE